MKPLSWLVFLGLWFWPLVTIRAAWAAPARPVDEAVDCEILVVGGGMAGVATAYEALKAGRTVCLTELTDWVGGQISSQGTSALDERPTQRSLLYFPQGYLEMRQRIIERYGVDDPGDCWVSAVCFLPRDGHEILMDMLKEAAKEGKGSLRFFPNTVVKDLQVGPVGSGKQIQAVRGIQHTPAPGAPRLNTYPLSQTIEDSYSEQDSALFKKKILQFIPPSSGKWYVIEATETGELLALANLPHRLGVDALSYTNPSASSSTDYPYCPQAYTYTFAMQATATPQAYKMPAFYPQYANSYSYNSLNYAQSPDLVFTYRRIWSVNPEADSRTVNPGDISMQNWNWGNDYGPGTPIDNYIYTQEQLAAVGQLNPGGWQGGLRVSSLRGAEEQALGYFYWVLAGTTDAKLGPVKQPSPNLRYLKGLDSPMGTVHGLSKYPYIREGRRLIGRYAYGYANGFTINEIDASRQNYQTPYYPETLSSQTYKSLEAAMAGLKAIDVIIGTLKPPELKWRTRSRIYSDSVGIGNYNIDFHPCMKFSPPQRPGNIERPGERQAAAETYPFQIPLRAMIPPKIDNLLVTGKNIATSHISAAAYRVQSFEWSVGAAAGTTTAFALEKDLLPYQLVENLPRRSPNLEILQKRLQANKNPIAFPGTSIFNENWQNWK
jgi:hypothetical protein